MDDEFQLGRPVTRTPSWLLGSDILFAKDPRRGFEKLLETMGHAEKKGQKAKELGREIQHLKSRERDASKQIASLRRTVERLSQENERLKSTKAHQIEKSFWALRRGIRNPNKVLTEAVALLRNQFKNSENGVAAANVQVDEFTNSQELMSVMLERPQAGILSKLLNRSYFREGKVRLPDQLASEHPELLSQLGQHEKQIVEMARGWLPFLTDEIYVPPRGAGTAYQPVPNSILYCVNNTSHFESNGYAIRTDGLVAALKEAGYDVTIFARTGYPWDSASNAYRIKPERRVEEMYRDTPVIYSDGASIHKTPFSAYLQVCTDAIVREASRKRVSLIHSASNHLIALPALIAARRLGIPFVYEVRGLWELSEASSKPEYRNSDRYNIARRLENLVISEADHVLAINQQVADRIIGDTGATSVSLLPNSIDSSLYRPLELNAGLKADLGIPVDATIVGYAGSVVEYEGLDDLIRAFDRISDKRPDLHIVIVGDGKAQGSLQELAAATRHKERIHFIGRVPHDEVKEYLSIFDATTCLRKRRDVTELVTPLKPLESMASGILVLGSDVAPVKDLLDGEDGPRGIIVPAEDIDAIGRALTEITNSERLPQGVMASRARLWVVDYRSWDSLARHVQNLYRNLSKQNEVGNNRRLKDVTLAVIADEFTATTISGATNVIELTPENWGQQLGSTHVDALFVESAWEGKDGAWRRKVGHYSDAESETLTTIINHCRQQRIPTIFWNKEDPVHTKRFLATATQFDHIFTTDADCIPIYQRHAATTKTIASASFFATPELHNPIPLDVPRKSQAVFAGTYYGNRFPERKGDLDALLEAAAATFGLVIFDRQADEAESPYRFPESLSDMVQGAVSYNEMLDIYRKFAVQLNVNSVTSSPTMFSRRVVEAIASGANVLSGPGMGVKLTLDGTVPVVTSKEDALNILEAWQHLPAVQLRDIWSAFRVVASQHLSSNRLTMMLRAAGVPAGVLPRPTVTIRYSRATSIVDQSVPAHLQPVASDSLSVPRNQAVVQVLQTSSDSGVAEIQVDLGDIDIPVDECFADDLVAIVSLTSLERFRVNFVDAYSQKSSMSERVQIDAETDHDQSQVQFNRPLLEVPGYRTEPPQARVSVRVSPTVLIAGHDLKFLGRLPEFLEDRGYRVTYDRWLDHTKHDVEESQRQLGASDFVFCEWALGNVEWYSQRVKPEQRLTTRFHLQELQRNYLDRARKENIGEVIFVSNQVRKEAFRKFNLGELASRVVSNIVDTGALTLPKEPGAEKTLGFVGIVPRRKRLDRALDLLSEIRRVDPEFSMRVKGKTHADYPWLADRPEELEYFEKQFERINSDPLLQSAVVFDGFGADMAHWYRRIGYAISTSDFESFHYTLSDGAASGAIPLSVPWAGADEMFPRSWVAHSTKDMAQRILALSKDHERRQHQVQDAYKFVMDNSSEEVVLPMLLTSITGGNVDESRQDQK